MKHFAMKFIFLLLLTPAGGTAEVRITDGAVIMKKILQICPGAVIVDREFREGFTEVEFMCRNQKIEAGFDSNNNLMYIEREAKREGELFETIKKKLDKSHKGWVIDDFHLVETGDTSFYSAELIKNGIEEKAYFTAEGKYYRPVATGAEELWTIETLSKTYTDKQLAYNFLKPSHIFEMPDVLREISGIAMASNNRMYLVQDELGALFVYNLNKEEVEEIIRFTDTGDFEDVAVNDREVYVLRSDGTIFSFSTGKQKSAPQTTQVPVQSLDNEGLFFDQVQDRLYLAAKSKPENGDSNHRLVYAMEPYRIYDATVETTISINEINTWINSNMPDLINEGVSIRFNPSAIAMHPHNGEMYVLSADDRLLAVYENNRLKQVYPLPAEIYYKPEGLAFAGNGDLFISSEGIKNGYLKGRIVKLKSIQKIKQENQEAANGF